MASIVYFIDEVFGTDKAWLSDFETQYKKEIGLPFYVEYNPQQLNSEMLNKLINAGLSEINIGIQTGSDYIRNRIFNRPGTNAEILSLTKKIVKYKIKIKYDLIIDNPYETEEIVKETIDFLLRLPKPLFFDLYSLQYFPGYPLTGKAIKDGYITAKNASIDKLIETTTKRWAFEPRLLPYSRKQMLKNIIWL